MLARQSPKDWLEVDSDALDAAAFVELCTDF